MKGFGLFQAGDRDRPLAEWLKLECIAKIP